MQKSLHSIKFRFFAGFFSFILIFLSMLPIIYTTNKRNKNDMRVIVNQSAQQRRVSEMAFLVNQYATTGQEDFLKHFNKEEEEFEKTFRGIANPPQELLDLWKSYKNMSIAIIAEVKKIFAGEDASLEEIATSKNKLSEIGAKLDASINSMIINIEKESLHRAKTIFIVTIILLTLAIFLGIFFMYSSSRVTLRPFLKIISELDSVSKGDLTNEIDVKIQFWGFTFNDEIAHLVDSVNTIIRNLRVSIGGIHRTSQDMSDVSRGLKVTSEGLKESAQTQFGAMKEASSSVDKASASMGAVAENTEELLKAAESASASSIEMSAAVISVAEHVEKLAVSIHRTSASISQIGASLQQVAAHVNTLFSTTEEAASYATEINYIVKDVGNSSREQAHLAEQVKRDASTFGAEAMDRTMSGMEKIKEEVAVTSAVIKRLAERSDEIGKIIEVIDEIADTTNLLSLNAAILAAQAGEHGLGFAVVSNEVKGLAKSTASRTKLIAELIGQMQDEVVAATSSIERTSARVAEGLKFSREAGDALSKITKSSEVSLDMAKKIEKAAEEQSQGVSQVVEAIQKVNSMVEGIKKATDEQTMASKEIMQATEDIKGVTQGVRHSTKEQSKQGKYISQVIFDVSQKMGLIANAMKEQKTIAEKIVYTIETIKKKTNENLLLTVELDKTVKNLDTQAVSLNEQVGGFKV